MKFNSRAFMIRFCEEEVELNDIGHFRVEIDCDQDAEGQPIPAGALQGKEKLNFKNRAYFGGRTHVLRFA